MEIFEEPVEHMFRAATFIVKQRIRSIVNKVTGHFVLENFWMPMLS